MIRLVCSGVFLVGSALGILPSHHSWHLADLCKRLMNVWSSPLRSVLLEGTDCVNLLFIILFPMSGPYKASKNNWLNGYIEVNFM